MGMTGARRWWALIAVAASMLALAFLPRRARPAAGPAESAAPGTGETGVQRAELGL